MSVEEADGATVTVRVLSLGLGSKALSNAGWLLTAFQAPPHTQLPLLHQKRVSGTDSWTCWYDRVQGWCPNWLQVSWPVSVPGWEQRGGQSHGLVLLIGPLGGFLSYPSACLPWGQPYPCHTV